MNDELKDLVDRVTARTKGTKGDPLTREEVEQVVRATLVELKVDASAEEQATTADIVEEHKDAVTPEGDA